MHRYRRDGERAGGVWRFLGRLFLSDGGHSTSSQRCRNRLEAGSALAQGEELRGHQEAEKVA
jgi:hypothetical protein